MNTEKTSLEGVLDLISDKQTVIVRFVLCYPKYVNNQNLCLDSNQNGIGDVAKNCWEQENFLKLKLNHTDCKEHFHLMNARLTE